MFYVSYDGRKKIFWAEFSTTLLIIIKMSILTMILLPWIATGQRERALQTTRFDQANDIDLLDLLTNFNGLPNPIK